MVELFSEPREDLNYRYERPGCPKGPLDPAETARAFPRGPLNPALPTLVLPHWVVAPFSETAALAAAR